MSARLLAPCRITILEAPARLLRVQQRKEARAAVRLQALIRGAIVRKKAREDRLMLQRAKLENDKLFHHEFAKLDMEIANAVVLEKRSRRGRGRRL